MMQALAVVVICVLLVAAVVFVATHKGTPRK